jgi:SAM-dependent methyltransferase
MSQKVSTAPRATGLGPITRDGCSVDLYRQLPYCGEVELISTDIPNGARVLEMGCGVGRVTKRLLGEGYNVTAVDNSPEMLAYVPPAATTICSNIEDLDLEEPFDSVLMASCLINVADDELRAAQLKACRRHLKAGGRLIFERYDPSWLSTVEVGRIGTIGEFELFADEVGRRGTSVQMCLRYEGRSGRWLHHFTASILDDEAVATCLSNGGLSRAWWINRTWASASGVEYAA